ncbi:N-glycosylase/DNA lyase OGG1, partial [Dictyocoela roeselum]
MAFHLIKTDQHINLKLSLFSGQAFHFQQTGVNMYSGVIKDILFTFKQDGRNVYYKIENEGNADTPDINGVHNSNPSVEKIVFDFFTLDINYDHLFSRWEQPFLPKIDGLRLLRLETIPTIFSFICSANNNIKRISKMVGFLYSRGSFIKEISGHKFYRFPQLDRLSDERVFRENMFGYRARYIAETAKMLMCRKIDLNGDVSHDEEKNSGISICVDQPTTEPCIKGNTYKIDLNKLKGVGRKVRDCIRLLSMDEFHVVPVDTHIFKVSKKLFNLSESKLTASVYRKIQDNFLEKFGEIAGSAEWMFFGDSLKLITG